jgi:hypothetical protein
LTDIPIAELLVNWGRWVRVRQHQGHCLSIEHRYRRHARPDDTPSGWNDWLSTPPPQTLPAVDVRAALEVERIMRHIPRRHRLALKLEYAMRMPWKVSCKRLSLPYQCWGEHLGEAQGMVAALLRRHEKARISGPTVRLPAPAETPRPSGAMGVAETA